MIFKMFFSEAFLVFAFCENFSDLGHVVGKGCYAHHCIYIVVSYGQTESFHRNELPKDLFYIDGGECCVSELWGGERHTYICTFIFTKVTHREKKSFV